MCVRERERGWEGECEKKKILVKRGRGEVCVRERG